MTNTKQASKAQSAKALAILHIQSHEGLDGVAVGDRIRYCEPSAGAGEFAFTEGEFTATEGDLQLAKMSRENAIELAKCAQESRAAYKITAEAYEVINAYNGKNVAYSDAEFTGTREECEDFIAAALAAQRKTPGMENTGTFLAIRDANTFEWA